MHVVQGCTLSRVSRQPQTFTDQIRQAIDASGSSRYAVSKAIGLSESTMSRFMAGKCGLSCETLDKVGRLLNLRVVAVEQRAKKTTKRRKVER